MTEKQKIGEVFTYFSKVGVAGIRITEGTLGVGDTISIEGHTTNFEQKIESMQIERRDIQKAEAGQSVGIKVKERVRPHDVVYKLVG
ncbi:MAG: translation elongation factor-like protein [Candidatus Altiarchaeales archaeon]|mgnify:CR=1 FL=1|nr:MAG: translation elongation factor-like protein [Candidatus Altiarchaeales archaeon]